MFAIQTISVAQSQHFLLEFADERLESSTETSWLSDWCRVCLGVLGYDRLYEFTPLLLLRPLKNRGNTPPMKRIPSGARALLLALLPLTFTAVNLPAMQELPPLPGPTVPIPDTIPIAAASEQPIQAEEVQLRGPVHEAFAEQFNQDPVEGVVIPRKPPELIEEIPPELRPDGRQIEWISGYWSWDDEEADFLWISGIWREVPQGFRWLPGYWSETENGYQWISGTWVSTQTEEIQYLETAPPQSLELGPVGVAPTVEHIWIPGCWNWSTTRYAWRPGYWSGGQSNWIWVPARYVCTPRGHVYSDGYWDYPLHRRGVLFAPCRFRGASHWNRPYRFTPRVIVAANLLPLHFWVRPNFRHYYFGDFYGNACASRGFQPWHRFHRQRRQFDPLFAHFSHSQSTGRGDYYDRVNRQFDLLSSHPDRRPFRDFSGQHQRVAANLPDNDDRPTLLGRTFQEHIQESGSAHFVKLENSGRQRMQDDTRAMHTLIEQRRDVERPTRGSGDNLRARNSDGPQTDPERTRRDTVGKDRVVLPGADGEKNQPGDPNKDKDGDSQPVVRRDRLKLPPSARREIDSEKSRSNAAANADNDSKERSPGNPVTRGERPRDVDDARNRARQSVNAEKKSRQDESPVVRERADRLPGQPLKQELQDTAKLKSARPKAQVTAPQESGASARNEPGSRVQQDLSRKIAPKDGVVGRKTQTEVKDNTDQTIRNRERPEPGLPGGTVPREGRVRSGQTSMPSQKSNDQGTIRSGGIGGRPDNGSARANPPQTSERSVRPPAAERPTRGATENHNAVRGNVRNEVRTDSARSGGPAARSQQPDTPRSSPVPRERGNPDSSGSGRRKK